MFKWVYILFIASAKDAEQGMRPGRTTDLGKNLPRRRTSHAAGAKVLRSRICCNCKRPVCPVWMASALQGKNALIARLVITVLCPAFDRGVDTFRWP